MLDNDKAMLIKADTKFPPASLAFRNAYPSIPW
jgi:hypothetical protein